MSDTKVIIIGAGPAGIACATQLKRYNIDSIIIEKEEIGGLIKNANWIENYPLHFERINDNLHMAGIVVLCRIYLLPLMYLYIQVCCNRYLSLPMDPSNNHK